MKNPLLTKEGIKRNIAKGHGQGKGAKYKPWLEVRHIPSNGKSSRVLGWKTNRIHSLLSRTKEAFFKAGKYATH